MKSSRVLGGVLGAAVALAAVAAIAARTGRGDVTVAHLDHPDAAVGSAGPTDDALGTPLVVSTASGDATAIAALRVQPAAGGAPLALGTLRGARGTIVAFWASYCIPCRDELPLLQSRASALQRQGVSVVLVDLQEDGATAAAFLRSLSISLTTYRDADGSAHDGLRLIGVPSTALLGGEGTVRTRLEGPDTLQLDGPLQAMGISPR
jgi:cytochrome c biogenesis protein CcmG/thiol:disulfide interchange protein DsbE